MTSEQRITSGLRAIERMRTCYAPAVVTLVVVAAFVMFRSSPAREPVYAGKTITEWLDGGYEPAAMVLEELGPSAVPWVFRALRHEHPSFDWLDAYAKIQRYAPTLLVSALPHPRATGFDELRAANLLIGMGPPVLPVLRAGLQDGNPAVRTACTMALTTLEPKRAAAPQRSR
jgi:hypothetical protein